MYWHMHTQTPRQARERTHSVAFSLQERQPGGAILPMAFRSILYLDVFGWLAKNPPHFSARPHLGPLETCAAQPIAPRMLVDACIVARKASKLVRNPFDRCYLSLVVVIVVHPLLSSRRARQQWLSDWPPMALGVKLGGALDSAHRPMPKSWSNLGGAGRANGREGGVADSETLGDGCRHRICSQIAASLVGKYCEDFASAIDALAAVARLFSGGCFTWAHMPCVVPHGVPPAFLQCSLSAVGGHVCSLQRSSDPSFVPTCWRCSSSWQLAR